MVENQKNLVIFCDSDRSDNDKSFFYVRNSEARIKSQPLENHPLQTSFAVANAQAITSAKFLLKVWQSHVFTAQFICHCLINSHSSLFWLFLSASCFLQHSPHSQWPCSNDQEKVSNSFCENPETSQFITHPCPTLHHSKDWRLLPSAFIPQFWSCLWSLRTQKPLSPFQSVFKLGREQ